jgi:1,4-alpha-glucan branching enzyme
MAKKISVKPKKSTQHRKRVTLALKAPDAENVYLMGDFNQWNEKAHPMKLGADGLWEKTIMIQLGKYEYRFLVDGKWQNDPDNDNICPNCYGTMNNVLEISG